MVNYQDYILSKEWDRLRQWRIAKDKFKCAKCGFKHELRVHHKTYERLGHEDIDDLITLCVRCHNDIHYELKMSSLTQKQVAQSTDVTEEEYNKAKETSLLR